MNSVGWKQYQAKCDSEILFMFGFSFLLEPLNYAKDHFDQSDLENCDQIYEQGMRTKGKIVSLFLKTLA